MNRRIAILFLSVSAILATSCSSPNSAAIQRQAFELAEQGDQESLYRALDQLDLIAPEEGQVSYHELKVICLVRTNQLDAALDIARTAIETYPESFLLNYYIGKIYFEQENYRDALPYLHQACKFKVDDGNAMLLRALAAAKTADGSGNAYFLALSAIPEFKDNPLVYNEWAMWLLNTQQPEEAVRKLIEALRVQDSHPILALNAAVIYDGHLHLPQVAVRYYEIFKESADDSFKERHIAVQRRLQQIKEM